MKCQACKELCGNYYCSYTKEDFLSKDENIAFMEYYNIDFETAISDSYKEAYEAFIWSYRRGVRVEKWIKY